MKSEILLDYTALRARVPRGSLRTALTVTTHHLRHGSGAPARSRSAPAS